MMQDIPKTNPESRFESGIAGRLAALQNRIHVAERASARAEGAVNLIAVSKTQPASRIRQVYACGQRNFGENYLQEALLKQDKLIDCDICWHFIGPIQSNKTRLVASRFDWVHSIDRLKIAERLSEQRPVDRSPLNVCIQVNVSHEVSKGGVAPADLATLANAVAMLPGLRLRGLMTIPAPENDPARQRIPFRALRQAFDDLDVLGLDTLSMGMSDDLEAAIAEGSTLVRIGTALFGVRTKSTA